MAKVLNARGFGVFINQLRALGTCGYGPVLWKYDRKRISYELSMRRGRDKFFVYCIINVYTRTHCKKLNYISHRNL
jgi:hypothetical protein